MSWKNPKSAKCIENPNTVYTLCGHMQTKSKNIYTMNLSELFKAIDTITDSYEIGNSAVRFSRPTFSDIYTEKPGWEKEWKIKAYKEQVAFQEQKISNYDTQIQHLLNVQSQALDRKKELEELIKDLESTEQ